jgi:hypothetical protein
MTIVAVRQKTMPPSWYAIPGREVMIRPLPIEALLKTAAQFIEEATRYHRREFHPEFPMTGLIFGRAMRSLSSWFSEKLTFGDWRYEFNIVADTSYANSSAEILVSRKYFPMKICLIDQWIEALGHYTLFEDVWCAYTPVDLMGVLEGMFEQVNLTLERWNDICRNYKPYFTDPLPVYDMLEVILEQVQDVYFSGVVEFGHWKWPEFYTLLALRTFESIAPYRFGVWRFDVEITENGNWVLMQCYLKNDFFPEMAFILLETEASRFEVLPKRGFERYVENLLFSCERSMLIWNKLLDEGD